jgi:hypothetical protein
MGSVCAVRATAGPNAFRGSGPNRFVASDHALTSSIKGEKSPALEAAC